MPVAAAQMFVGRRPEMQATLRALRSGERAGVLLHSQGRLGKSSLAARIADRLADHAVAVVFGDYTALAVLDAIADAVRTMPAARELIERWLPEVRQRPEALLPVLIDLLTGPCAQTGEGQRPLLLMIDDLNRSSSLTRRVRWRRSSPRSEHFLTVGPPHFRSAGGCRAPH